MRARCILLGLALGFALEAPTSAEELVVIVHRERATSVSVDQLRQIYLKQRRFWAGGDGIQPVNREAESRERGDFARAIFSETPQQLAVYWNRQYFNGVLPPATLASDRAVMAYVAIEKRAIGYVRASAVDDSVRVVMRLPEQPSHERPPLD